MHNLSMCLVFTNMTALGQIYWFQCMQQRSDGQPTTFIASCFALDWTGSHATMEAVSCLMPCALWPQDAHVIKMAIGLPNLLSIAGTQPA